MKPFEHFGITLCLLPSTVEGVRHTIREVHSPALAYARNPDEFYRNHTGSSLMRQISALASSTQNLQLISAETVIHIYQILIFILLFALYLAMFCTCHKREIIRVVTTSKSCHEILVIICKAMYRSNTRLNRFDPKPPGKCRTKWDCIRRTSQQIEFASMAIEKGDTNEGNKASITGEDPAKICANFVVQDKPVKTKYTRPGTRLSRNRPRSMSHINYKPIILHNSPVTYYGGSGNRRVKLIDTNERKIQLSDQSTSTEGFYLCRENIYVTDMHEYAPTKQHEMLPIDPDKNGYTTVELASHNANATMATSNERADVSIPLNGSDSKIQLKHESGYAGFYDARTDVHDDDTTTDHANLSPQSTEYTLHAHSYRPTEPWPLIERGLSYFQNQIYIEFFLDSRENVTSSTMDIPALASILQEFTINGCKTERTSTEHSSFLKSATQGPTSGPYEFLYSETRANIKYLQHDTTTQTQVFCQTNGYDIMFKLSNLDINGWQTILKMGSRMSNICQILMYTDGLIVTGNTLPTESSLLFIRDNIDDLPITIQGKQAIVGVGGGAVSVTPADQNPFRVTCTCIETPTMSPRQIHYVLMTFLFNDVKGSTCAIQWNLKFNGKNRFAIEEVNRITDCITGSSNVKGLTADETPDVQLIMFWKHDKAPCDNEMFVPRKLSVGFDSGIYTLAKFALLPKTRFSHLVTYSGTFDNEICLDLMDMFPKRYQQYMQIQLPFLETSRALCVERNLHSVTHKRMDSVDSLSKMDSLNNAIDSPITPFDRFYDKYDSQQSTKSSGYYTRDSSQSTLEPLNITDESLNTLYSSTNSIPVVSVEESRRTVDVEEDLDSNMDTLPDENMETSEYETQSRQIVTSVSRFETSTESYKSTNADNECIVTRRHCNTCTCPQSEYVAKVPNDMYNGEESLSNSENINSEKHTNNVSSLDQNEETTSKSLISEFDNYETAASELSYETPIKLPVDLSISLIYEPSDIDLHCGSNREVCAPNDNTQMYSFYDGNSITHTTTEILHTSASSFQSNANPSEELSINLHLCEQSESPSSDRCRSCRMLKIENIELKQSIRRILATHSDHNNIDDIYCPSINSDNPIGFLDENALDVFNLDTSSCDIFAREEESLQSSYDFRSTIFAPIKTCYDESNAENNHPPKFNSNDYLKREHNKTTLEEIQELNAALPLIPDIQNRFKKLTEYTWIKRIVSNGRFVRIKYDAMDHTNAVRFIKEATGMQSDQFECIYDAPKNI